jgi:hypothetical protein
MAVWLPLSSAAGRPGHEALIDLFVADDRTADVFDNPVVGDFRGRPAPISDRQIMDTVITRETGDVFWFIVGHPLLTDPAVWLPRYPLLIRPVWQNRGAKRSISSPSPPMAR